MRQNRDRPLPEGVVVHELEPHHDDRGVFTEVWRQEWSLTPPMPQWNVVRSEADVLRGVHVHLLHDDYLTVLDGSAVVGLCDLRVDSPSFRAAAMLRLDADAATALVIPHGVAHGFLFLEPSIHCYAVSRYFDSADELGCRYDDPELGLAWPETLVRLSPRDEQLPPLGSLLDQLAPHRSQPEPTRP